VSFSVYSATEASDPIFGVRVSPGSAEISVSRRAIANHLSVEYSLSNISPKKLPKLVKMR